MQTKPSKMFQDDHKEPHVKWLFGILASRCWSLGWHASTTFSCEWNSSPCITWEIRKWQHKITTFWKVDDKTVNPAAYTTECKPPPPRRVPNPIKWREKLKIGNFAERRRNIKDTCFIEANPPDGSPFERGDAFGSVRSLLDQGLVEFPTGAGVYLDPADLAVVLQAGHVGTEVRGRLSCALLTLAFVAKLVVQHVRLYLDLSRFKVIHFTKVKWYAE